MQFHEEAMANKEYTDLPNATLHYRTSLCEAVRIGNTHFLKLSIMGCPHTLRRPITIATFVGQYIVQEIIAINDIGVILGPFYATDNDNITA